MTPDDDRDSARIDGLFVSYGQIMEVVARLDERAGGHDRELKAMREQRREDIAAMTKAFDNVDRSCGEKVLSVKADFRKAIDGVGKEIGAVKKAIEDTAKRADAKRERNEWTLTQKVALASATFSPLVAAVALVVK